MNRGVIAWFAHNHVAANLLMLLLVVGGLLSLMRMTQKEFPDIDINRIIVTVEDRGAAPEEVEAGVCVRIEEAVQGIEGIDRLTSSSVEGMCAVTIQLLAGTDPAKALDDVKAQVDALTTLPEETEKPIVRRASIMRGVADVAVSGQASERSLKELAERVRDEILQLPGITQVEVVGTRPYEISIEVSETSLRRYGLSFDQVAQAVRRASLDLPGGSIKTDAGEILLRTKGQAYRGSEFGRLVVLTRPDGTRVQLHDVAQVVDGFEDTDQATSFDGAPAAIVRVFRVGNQDLLAISDAVKAYVAKAQARVPNGVHLTVWRDGSTELRGRIDTMLRNGRMGFALVLLVLALFLRLRLAFWVALGVPVAFCGALWVLPAAGIDINVISLFGFILVLGILVDDAIVVGENVYTHQQRGMPAMQAAVEGTREVSVPVIFGVLTTVVAFVPLLLVEGQMGQIFGVMATVVIACLIFSLLEAQWVLPAHLAHGLPTEEAPPRNPVSRWWVEFQGRFAEGFASFTQGRYRRTVEGAMRWRYVTAAGGVALLVITVAVMESGRLKFNFFPDIQADYISAELTMPQGTPVAVTRAALEKISMASETLRRNLDRELGLKGRSSVRHTLISVGSQPSLAQVSQNPATAGGPSNSGSHLGEVTLELMPAEARGVRSAEIARRWRALAPQIPEADALVFSSALFSVGDAVNVELQGPRVDQLEAAAGRLRRILMRYPGVYDVRDSFRSGKQEVKLSIRPAAQALGLSLRDLAQQVRQAFYGEEVQRVQRGRDDVRVMVRYPSAERRSLADLDNLRVRTADGAQVPFQMVARATLGRGFANIRRADRERVVNVTASVDVATTSAGQVLDDLRTNVLPPILADYPGMRFDFEGAQRVQGRALRSLLSWMLVALFGIYALLAIPLRSYVQPLLIMSVIPFGLVGAIFGHLLMKLVHPDFGLSFMSVTGIVALTGVVVNDSLVLVHTVNRRRAQGEAEADAIVGACVGRLRPIVLTSLTTFAGLSPLLAETSVQAQFLVPMATSLAFGVLFATLITLILLPAVYMILADLRALPARHRERLAAAVPLPVEAAARRDEAPVVGGGK